MNKLYVQAVVSKTKSLTRLAFLGVTLFTNCSAFHMSAKDERSFVFSPKVEGVRFDPELKRELDPNVKKELRILDLLGPSLKKAKSSENAEKDKMLREIALKEVCTALRQIEQEGLDIGLAHSVARDNLGKDRTNNAPCSL